MGWGSGNLGGGGSGKLFAAIGVTYPVGSTLTCTNGTKTLKAKTTTGQWVFAIPEVGAWTVTSTDPTGANNPVSQTAEITTEGQFASVELSYDLILFNRTDECSAVTGGWQAVGGYAGPQGWGGRAPTVTKNTDSYKLSFPASAGSIFSTTNKIDLSGYNTLKALLQHNANISLESGQYMFGVFDIDTLGMNGMLNAAAKVGLNNTTVGEPVELSLDVSNVSGEHHVGFGHYAATTDIIDKLLKVWAVK